MNKILIAVVSVMVAAQYANPATAQDTFIPPHTSSTISSTDRYEIVQSHLAAKWTFRLDRFCGSVSILVSTTGDGTAWQNMTVEAKPPCKLDGRTHYQLFSSSLAARHTFLMNTETGKTWLLVSHKAADGTTSDGWDLFDY
jgi:hypothetical protein